MSETEAVSTANGSYVEFAFSGDTAANWFDVSLFSEEHTGEIVNDTVYERNLFAENRYNVDITYEGSGDVASAVKQTVTSGSSEYSVVWELLNRVLTPAQEGYLRNLTDISTLNLDGSGWDANSVEALAMAGKLYFVCGDINVHTIEGCSAVFFSKSVLRKRLLPSCRISRLR